MLRVEPEEAVRGLTSIAVRAAQDADERVAGDAAVVAAAIVRHVTASVRAAAVSVVHRMRRDLRAPNVAADDDDVVMVVVVEAVAVATAATRARSRARSGYLADERMNEQASE